MTNSIETRKQDNSYAVYDCNGKQVTGLYVYASNINEARKIFKSNPAYAKYRYYGSIKRVYNGGVRG